MNKSRNLRAGTHAAVKYDVCKSATREWMRLKAQSIIWTHVSTESGNPA